MSTIEFAEELNQPRHRFSNTAAMIAKAAELAFVRRAVASSVLGRARALVLSGLLASVVAAQADNAETSVDANASDNSESSGSNAANNPVEPRLTLQYWNYYAPSLNHLNGDAESGEARVLIPFQIAGVQQIMHIVPPVVTNPTTTSGPRTGLGDTQIYNFTLGKFDLGLPQKVTFRSRTSRRDPDQHQHQFRHKQAAGGRRRYHSCASELGSPGRAGDLSANALGSQLSCDRRAAADLLQSASRILPALVGPHDL
jgi:hypothetical protein